MGIWLEVAEEGGWKAARCGGGGCVAEIAPCPAYDSPQEPAKNRKPVPVGRCNFDKPAKLFEHRRGFMAAHAGAAMLCFHGSCDGLR
jgi:hypothetical protein